LANHQQAKKRARQTTKRNTRNAALRSTTRKCVTRVRAAVAAGDAAPAKEALETAISQLDRMVTKDIVKRHTASRTISRLTVAVNKMASK